MDMWAFTAGNAGSATAAIMPGSALGTLESRALLMPSPNVKSLGKNTAFLFLALLARLALASATTFCVSRFSEFLRRFPVGEVRSCAGFVARTPTSTSLHKAVKQHRKHSVIDSTAIGYSAE